ncbi:phage tail protein, partial [Staphylococcus aureus]
FKIYCIYPDNKTLHIYDQASWVKKTAKRLAYRYNTPTVTFQIDSSSFTNKIRVISTHVNDQIIADQEKAIEKADAVIKAKQDEITKDAATLSKMRKEQTKLRSEMSKITKVPLKKRTATQKAKLSSLQSTYNTNKKQIDAFNSTLIGKRSEQKKRRAEIKKSREKLRTDKKKDRSQPLFEPFDYED